MQGKVKFPIVPNPKISLKIIYINLKNTLVLLAPIFVCLVRTKFGTINYGYRNYHNFDISRVIEASKLQDYLQQNVTENINK